MVKYNRVKYNNCIIYRMNLRVTDCKVEVTNEKKYLTINIIYDFVNYELPCIPNYKLDKLIIKWI